MTQALEPKDYDTFLRWALTCDLERAQQLEQVLFDTLRRVGLGRRRPRAVTGKAPAGSDHFSSMAVKEWCERIQAGDVPACRQLQQLEATVAHRLGL